VAGLVILALGGLFVFEAAPAWWAEGSEAQAATDDARAEAQAARDEARAAAKRSLRLTVTVLALAVPNAVLAVIGLIALL
jgi:hypothetical protein